MGAGRPKLIKKLRVKKYSLSMKPDVSEFLDKIPEGKISEWVNEALKEKIRKEKRNEKSTMDTPSTEHPGMRG